MTNSACLNLRTFWLGAILLCLSAQLHGQAGLRDTLDKMDKNKNGYLDPNEVTDLSRPFLERILGDRYGRRRPVDFDDPIPVSRIQEAARYYFAIKNGIRGTDVRPESRKALKSFNLDRDDRIVPSFGIGEIKFPVIKADMDEAERTIQRCDRNRDGMVDAEEARRNEWTHRNPFDDDLNKDGKLSKQELAQRYARRRLVSEDAGELWKKSIRTGGEVKNSVAKAREEERRRWTQGRGRSAKLTYDLLSRFDRNRDRKLEEDEMRSLGIPFAKLDINKDSFVTQQELQETMELLQKEASATMEGVPTWFMELDKNKNEQIEMVEFAEEWTESKLAEFAEMDKNSDGILTTDEVIAATSSSGAQYVSKEAEIIAPKKSIISEIEIEDDFKIGSIQVTLSITHTYSSQLDCFLLGPDGKRIELFTAVGGSDDNFVNTVFDDESRIPIVKSRPPFTGTFRPEAIDKKQPGLNQYKGRSCKGTWQLIVRGTRSERFGMLHQWGLKLRPEEE